MMTDSDSPKLLRTTAIRLALRYALIYALVMGSCIALMLFGFFVPVPVPVRLVALAVAAVLAPLAAIVGNGGPSG